MKLRRKSLLQMLEAEKRRADQAIAQGAVGRVVPACQAALKAVDAAGREQPDKEDIADVLEHLFSVAAIVGRYDVGLELCWRRAQFQPDDMLVPIDEAICLFELTEFDQAADILDQLRETCEPHPEIEWYSGALLERRGDFAGADRLFARAHRLSPDEFPPPIPFTQAMVDAVLGDLLEALPSDVEQALTDVPVILDPLPPLELLRMETPPLSPLILGLHHGANLRDESNLTADLDVSGIRVFPRNVAKICRNRQEFENELHITLLHEIGHRLGLDEDDLMERGIE